MMDTPVQPRSRSWGPAAGVYDLTQTGSAVVLLVGAVPVVMILLLAGPPSSRAYFRRSA
jgi:hypothetical protein